MRILYLFNKGMITADLILALQEAGHRVEGLDDFECSYSSADENCYRTILQKVQTAKYDLLISFNFVPTASRVCNECGIRYVAWQYDAYQTTLYNPELYYPCNYIFVMDSEEYEYLSRKKLPHVYYLPLAVNTERIGAMDITDADEERFASQISFVGSLYEDIGRNGYRVMIPRLTQEQQKRIEACADLLECHWERKILDVFAGLKTEQLVKIDAMDDRALSELDDVRYYSVIAYSKLIAERERKKVLNTLAQNHQVRLYTYSDTAGIAPQIEVRPPVSYYDEMPKVFYFSRINLNITLRAIQNGIPLRVFDIMGAGGFLLTNRQKDMDHYFTEGKDYAAFSDMKELQDMTAYYLAHERERLESAMNGDQKVRELHNYRNRREQMFQILEDTGENQ